MPQICVRLTDEQKRHLDEEAAGSSVAAVVRRLIEGSRERARAHDLPRLLPKSVDLDMADALSRPREEPDGEWADQAGRGNDYYRGGGPR